MNEDVQDNVVDIGVPFGDDHGGTAPEAVGAGGFRGDLVDEFAVDEASGAPEDTSFVERIHQTAQEQEAFNSLPKFDYKFSSTDATEHEIEQWFDLNDIYQLDNSKREYLRRHDDWFGIDDHTRRSIVKGLIHEVSVRQHAGADGELNAHFHSSASSSSLSSDSSGSSASFISDATYPAAQCLAYIAEGAFGESTDLKFHIAAIKKNCELLWKCGAFPVILHQTKTIIELKLPTNLSTPRPDLQAEWHLDQQLALMLTCLYLMLETLRNNDEFVNDVAAGDVPIVIYFVDVIARSRWLSDHHLPFRKLVLILWKALLCQFGDEQKLAHVKKYVRRKYNLSAESDPDIITVSPLDYHAFRADVVSRYPSYVPPPSVLPDRLDNTHSISHFIQVPRPSHAQASNAALPVPTMHIATPAPSPPLSPALSSGQKLRKSLFMTNQSFPFLYPSDQEIPQSIVEAGELFASRIRTTPASIQLWDERDKFMQHERGWQEDGPKSAGQEETNGAQNGKAARCPEEDILQRVDDVYSDSMLTMSSFINVLLRQFLQAISFQPSDDGASAKSIDSLRCREITLKAIVAIFDNILCWYKVNHVLKFEYLAALLFDARYYLFVYKFLYSTEVLNRALYRVTLRDLNFFSRCQDLSEAAKPAATYGHILDDMGAPMSVDEARYCSNITSYSRRYLSTLVMMVRVLRRVVRHKTQRIVIVSELPFETLKKALTIYQSDLWREVLDLFKEQVPFNGKKWKYNNMDLISAIYLNCKPRLRDDWLSGLDVNSEIDDAYPQEVGLRSLVKFYNCQHYGLEDDGGSADFFARELDSLSLNAGSALQPT